MLDLGAWATIRKMTPGVRRLLGLAAVVPIGVVLLPVVVKELRDDQVRLCVVRPDAVGNFLLLGRKRFLPARMVGTYSSASDAALAAHALRCPMR